MCTFTLENEGNLQMQPLRSHARLLGTPPRSLVLPALMALVSTLASCATGGSTTDGEGGIGGSSTTEPLGGGGEGGAGGGGGGGSTGGEGGGSTTTTTSTSTSSTSSTTSSTTSTTTSTAEPCGSPEAVDGHTTEQEPNAIPALAAPIVAGDLGFAASICPPGDVDVFAIPVSVAGASLHLEVKGNGVACPPGAQTYLRVFDANNQLIAQDTANGQASCSLISPLFQSGVASLPAGTYYAQVESVTFATIDAYLLDVVIKEPSCGDGVLQEAANEQCDDGNNVDGDGCTAGCLVEVECGDGVTHTVAGEECDDGNAVGGDGCSAGCLFEANLLHEDGAASSQDMPLSLVGYDGALGAITPVGDADWYSFEVTVPDSTVTISTSDGLKGCPPSTDTDLALFDAMANQLAYDDDDGEGACSALSPVTDAGVTGLAVGTYLVRVRDYNSNNTIPSYVLLLDVSTPGCGDGILQAGEQCDDGNLADDDGCSALCAAEPPYEVEPNDELATATAPWPGYGHWTGSITPAGDHDWFEITLQAGQSLTIVTHTIGDLGSCPFDTEIHLVSSAGVEIAFDDDGNPNNTCSVLSSFLHPALVNLPAGTYYVWVQQHGDTSAAGAYQLDVTIQ